MGLNYNYLLYFKRDQLWDVLQGLSDYCDTDGMKPTTVQFADHQILLPLTTAWVDIDVVQFDDPEYKFAISMLFDEDPEILDYLGNRVDDLEDRCPPEDGTPKQYPIGTIYLTVTADLSKHDGFDQPHDMALFEFGTTGTKMSTLFCYSTSIRKTFIQFLEHNHGIYGIFDWEDEYGELFWFRGEQMAYKLANYYQLPDAIEAELQRGS